MLILIVPDPCHCLHFNVRLVGANTSVLSQLGL